MRSVLSRVVMDILTEVTFEQRPTGHVSQIYTSQRGYATPPPKQMHCTNVYTVYISVPTHV